MTRVLNAIAIVSVPILPTNIEVIIMAFPAAVSEAVMPMERPTVPNAENSSKNNLSKSTPGSVMVSRKVEINIIERENNAIE